MMEYEQEEQIDHSELFQNGATDDDPEPKITATYLPQLSLHLEDNKGALVEGKESKFFQLGHRKGQIHPKLLKWKGLFKVIPRSIIDNSQTLVHAAKMEMANLLVPLFSSPLPNAMQQLAKIAKQIVKVHEEDEDDWLPDTWVQFLKQAGQPQQPGQPQGQPGGMPGQPAGAPPGMGAPGAPGQMPQGVPPQGGSMQGQQGMAPPQAPTAVPSNQISSGTPPPSGLGQIFQRKM
jgi:hypothetical protein